MKRTPEEVLAQYAANRKANADKPNRGHIWSLRTFDQFGLGNQLEVCQQCGVFRRRDDNNKPCVGVVKVGLR